LGRAVLAAREKGEVAICRARILYAPTPKLARMALWGLVPCTRVQIRIDRIVSDE
jgi:hypothetical protein